MDRDYGDFYGARDQKPNSKVYVGNLSDGTTEDELRANFEKFGDILSVKIAQGKEKNRCAFVEYAD